MARNIDSPVYMTATEFRTTLSQLGLSADLAAIRLHMSRSTIFQYANGQLAVPPQIAMLLRVMTHRSVSPADLAKLAFPQK